MYDLAEYQRIKENSIKGRYVTMEMLGAFLDKTSSSFSIRNIGKSVLNRNIRLLTLGHGPIKILMWSQMHGNESTTTKAVLDLINFLSGKSRLSSSILDGCTIKIIPILNPDGASAYTRANANGIDLNRDARNLSQPESKVLRAVYVDFGPDYCFNLHDQRTIFNVGDLPNPATVSFLAPTYDEEHNISITRGKSMKLIVAMEQKLQKIIPGRISRFDDAFNPNCVGDAFQMMDTPTILFEAGHSPGDYQREKTREYIFYALLTAIEVIAKNQVEMYGRDEYFKIPENHKLYFDVVLDNVHEQNKHYKNGDSIGILFREVLEDNRISFEPYIEKTGNLNGYFGHRKYNCLDKSDLERLKEERNLYELLF